MVIVKNYFSKKIIEYDEEIDDTYRQASNLMLHGAIEIEGKKFSTMEIQRKINTSEDEEEKNII